MVRTFSMLQRSSLKNWPFPIPALVIIVCAIGASSSVSAAQSTSNAQWAEYYVPDQKTAVAIAEAVSRPLVDKKDFANILPFQAVDLDGDWFVTSKPGLPGPDPCDQPHFVVVKISRVTGAIIEWSIDHGENMPLPSTRACRDWWRKNENRPFPSRR